MDRGIQNTPQLEPRGGDRHQREDSMSSSYAEALKDPRWQKKRLEILSRDNWKCRRCDRGDKTLHVHHTRYFRGHMPWEYEGRCLRTLCEPCHERETDLRKALDEWLALLKQYCGHGAMLSAMGFMAGLLWKGSGDTAGLPISDPDQAVGIGAAYGATAEASIAAIRRADDKEWVDVRVLADAELARSILSANGLEPAEETEGSELA